MAMASGRIDPLKAAVVRLLSDSPGIGGNHCEFVLRLSRWASARSYPR